MQTFLPYANFIESSESLDYKRLGKQRVEAKQILQINLVKMGKEHVSYCPTCETFRYDESRYCTLHHPVLFYNNEDLERLKLHLPWENHPAVRMWRGYEKALALYGCVICTEWMTRGYKDTLWDFFSKVYNSEKEERLTPWLGNKDFHLSHQSNLVRKDPGHYRHYFPDVPDNLPYVWPV